MCTEHTITYSQKAATKAFLDHIKPFCLKKKVVEIWRSGDQSSNCAVEPAWGHSKVWTSKDGSKLSAAEFCFPLVVEVHCTESLWRMPDIPARAKYFQIPEGIFRWLSSRTTRSWTRRWSEPAAASSTEHHSGKRALHTYTAPSRHNRVMSIIETLILHQEPFSSHDG